MPKKRVSRKSRRALNRVNSLAKGVARKHPGWKRTSVMKEAGVLYRKKYGKKKKK